MKKKDFFKKLRSKAGTGILFVAACFAAAFILFEFHDNYIFVGIAAVLLLLSAYLFLNALFEDKAKEWSALEDEEFHGKPDGEFRLRVLKYIKENEGTQKETLAAINKQNEILTEQIENLEHEIYMLSEKQLTQTKTVIRFNKENARQLALNERDTLEKAVKELKCAITGESSEEAGFAEEEMLEDDTIGFAEEDSAMDDTISFTEEESVMDDTIGFTEEDSVMDDTISFAEEDSVMDDTIGFAEEDSVMDDTIGFAEEESVMDDTMSFAEEDSAMNDEIFLGGEGFEEPEVQEDIVAFELPEDFGLEDNLSEDAASEALEEILDATEGLEIPDDITKMLEDIEN